VLAPVAPGAAEAAATAAAGAGAQDMLATATPYVADVGWATTVRGREVWLWFCFAAAEPEWGAAPAPCKPSAGFLGSVFCVLWGGRG